MWFGVDWRPNTKKSVCLKDIGPMCPKYANYSRLNSQHDQEDLHDPLNEHMNLHLKIMNKMFMWALKTTRVHAQLQFANHLTLTICFIYPTKSGCREKYIHLRHIIPKPLNPKLKLKHATQLWIQTHIKSQTFLSTGTRVKQYNNFISTVVRSVVVFLFTIFFSHT
jgi:hypothetical protein